MLTTHPLGPEHPIHSLFHSFIALLRTEYIAGTVHTLIKRIDVASAFLKLLVQVMRSLEQSTRSDVIVEAEGVVGAAGGKASQRR